MTSKTLLLRYHRRRLFPEGVALKAGKCLHADAVDTLVLVAVLTGALIRPEEMETSAVTYLAFKVEHEHVLGMTVGFSQCNGALGNLAEMTGLALRPRSFSPVGARELAFSFCHVSHQKLVLLYKGEVVALLTDDISMLTPLPLLKGLLHHMA